MISYGTFPLYERDLSLFVAFRYELHVSFLSW